MMANYQKMKIKKVSTRLPEDIFRRAKADAALEGIPLQKFLARILTDWIGNRKDKSK